MAERDRQRFKEFADSQFKPPVAPAAVEAWAIKAPDGTLIVNTNNDTKEKAWRSNTPGLLETAKACGFVCVRVTVTEVQE